MSYQIIQNSSKDVLLDEAARNIHTFLVRAPLLLLLSGGSALDILDRIDISQLNENVTITVLDERYSEDPLVNNFAQISGTSFYKNAIKKSARFIDTHVTNRETLSEVAEKFEHSLRNWRTAHPAGLMVATQGIGPDGHTSGVMPMPEDRSRFNSLFCKENWVAGYDAGNKTQYSLRVTTTITFLKMIDHSIVYATGENKKTVLHKALLSSTKLEELPCKIIQDMKNVAIYTDQKI